VGRNENITLVIGCNATLYIMLPPLIIFRGVGMNKDLTKGVPEDAIYSTSLKGFINSEMVFN